MEPLAAAIEVRSLSKSVGPNSAPIVVLRGLDLTVRRGEFVAVTGASGSGKSTLLHLIAGLDSPSNGQILVAGQNLAQMDEDAKALYRRDHVGLIFQAFHLLDILSAEENVAMPLALAGVTTREANRRAAEWLAAVGLTHRKSHRPDQLSGGEQQRVAIARALVAGPAVLLADEPTGNLDSHSRTYVMQLLRDVVDQMGVTLLMVTHDPACAALADRELRMVDGSWHGETPSMPVPRPRARAA